MQYQAKSQLFFPPRNRQASIKALCKCRGPRISRTILKNNKLEDSLYLISKLTTKLQQSGHCDTYISIGIEINGIELRVQILLSCNNIKHPYLRHLLGVGDYVCYCVLLSWFFVCSASFHIHLLLVLELILWPLGWASNIL